MVNWKFYNFICSLIREELDIDEPVYLNTEDIQVELEGDTTVYYVPIEYGHELADVKLEIYPDFTCDVRLY